MNGNGPRITAVLGTMREGNYTRHALAHVVRALTDRGAQVSMVDAGSLDLAFPGKGTSPDGEALVQAVREADGVVLATPEYHGSFSAAMKLVIENLGFPSVLDGKPVALLGVAAGRIGAIKSLEHLRSVASHVGAVVLPGPVSIARVREVFDAGGECRDAAVTEQLDRLAERLVAFLQTHVCRRAALEEMVRDGQA